MIGFPFDKVLEQDLFYLLGYTNLRGDSLLPSQFVDISDFIGNDGKIKEEYKELIRNHYNLPSTWNFWGLDLMDDETGATAEQHILAHPSFHPGLL